jgi:hypothetical protein
VWQDIQVMPYRVAPHYDFPPCPWAKPWGAQTLRSPGGGNTSFRDFESSPC